MGEGREGESPNSVVEYLQIMIFFLPRFLVEAFPLPASPV
jgi:hypothetical protein